MFMGSCSLKRGMTVRVKPSVYRRPGVLLYGSRRSRPRIWKYGIQIQPLILRILVVLEDVRLRSTVYLKTEKIFVYLNMAGMNGELDHSLLFDQPLTKMCLYWAFLRRYGVETAQGSSVEASVICQDISPKDQCSDQRDGCYQNFKFQHGDCHTSSRMISCFSAKHIMLHKLCFSVTVAICCGNEADAEDCCRWRANRSVSAA